MNYIIKPFSFLLVFFISLSCSYGLEKKQNTLSDSLDIYYSKSDFGQAINYLLRTRPNPESTDDSTQIEWLIDYSQASSYNAKREEAFSSIQNALSLAKDNFDSLYFKANVQLIEFYRSSGLHLKAIILIRSMEKKGLKYTGAIRSRFYHRSAAVYNELHYIKNNPIYIDTAIQYSYKALNISRKLNLGHDKAISYNELGSIYDRQGELKKSINYYDSAQIIWKEISLVNYVNVIKNKSVYFLNKQELDSSKAYIEKALSLIEGKNFYRMKSESYWVLKQIYYLQKDTLSGLKIELEEARYNVLYLERKMKERLENLTIQYDLKEKDLEISRNKETIKKEKEQVQITAFIITVLISLIAFIIYLAFVSKQKNNELKALLKENDFLVGEANHRIKNNLQLIISLLGREMYKKDNKTEETNALNNIVEKINAIATLHQQLYLSKSKKEVSVSDYIENIGNNFQAIFQDHNIELSINVTDFSMNLDQAVYLGLLTTELFTNSIKHAFSEQKNNTISIVIEKENKTKVLFDYQDNGIGLKKNEEPSLVNLLLKQLKAESQHSSHTGYKLKTYFKL